MLIVRSLDGIEEMLTDYTPPERRRRVNGDNTLSFSLFSTERNAHSYGMCEEESVIVLGDDEYKIKSVRKVGSYQKQIDAIHIFFDDFIGIQKYTTITGITNFVQALDFVFEGTNWSYVNQTATVPVTFDKFGGDNCLALIQTIIDRYKVEFTIDNKNKQIIFRTQVGDDKDAQFRYRHNIKTFEQDVDTKNLSTRIKGYGKKYAESDILSGNPGNFTSQSGTWVTSSGPVWKTNVVGTYFAFNYAGTGIRLWFYGASDGGVWKVIIDNDKTEEVSTWRQTAGLTYVDLFRNMPEGIHNITAYYQGGDKDHASSSGAGNYFGYICFADDDSQQKTFEPYRFRKDEELYTVQYEYTSPNASKYGIKDAKPFQSDEYTTVDQLEQACKDTIIDVPEIQFKTEIVQLLDNGEIMHEFDVGDRVFMFYEPHNVSMRIRIIEMLDYPLHLKKSPIVDLSNFNNLKNNITSTLSDFAQTQKSIRNLLDEEGNLQLTIKKLYRNSHHWSDHTGDTWQDPDDPNVSTHIGSGGLVIHGGAAYIERADGYAMIIDGILQHGLAIQSSNPPFQTAGVEKWGSWYRVTTTNRYENIDRYTLKHDSRYVHVVVDMFTDNSITGYIVFDVVQEDENGNEVVVSSSTVTETRHDENQGFKKDILIDLGTPTGELVTIYWRMYGSDPNWYVYGNVRFIEQEG